MSVDGFADHEEFVCDFLFRVANAGERIACTLKLALLDVPAWRLRDEWRLRNDENRDEQLENDDHLPVPLAEASTAGDVLLAAVVDPDLELSAFRLDSFGKVDCTYSK